MNFRIVDGTYEYDDEIDFESLAKDYSDPNVTVDEMCKKHDISRKRYYRLHKRLIEMTGLKRKATNRNGGYYINRVNRHISFDKRTRKYRISKFVDGKLLRFGNYDTFEEAVKVRDDMIEHNWDFGYFLDLKVG